MSVHVIGSFPSLLYRAFSKVEYARSFLEQGIFQLNPLSYYCKIEDTNRKDKVEGEGKAVIFTDRPVLTLDKKSGIILSQTNEFGPVYFKTSSINPRYILCFSGPQVDIKHLANQYGKYVVCLSQPNQLVSDIACYLEKCSNMPDVMWLECVQVRYDKEQVISQLPKPASEERARMSYGQKHPIFLGDCEYRLVLEPPISLTSCPIKIKIDLQKKLEYTEMLRLSI